MVDNTTSVDKKRQILCRYCADIAQKLMVRCNNCLYHRQNTMSLLFGRHFVSPVVHAHRHSFGFAVSAAETIGFMCRNVFSVELPLLPEHRQAGERRQGCYPILLPFFALRRRQPLSRLYNSCNGATHTMTGFLPGSGNKFLSSGENHEKSAAYKWDEVSVDQIQFSVGGFFCGCCCRSCRGVLALGFIMSNEELIAYRNCRRIIFLLLSEMLT